MLINMSYAMKILLWLSVLYLGTACCFVIVLLIRMHGFSDETDPITIIEILGYAFISCTFMLYSVIQYEYSRVHSNSEVETRQVKVLYIFILIL